MGDIIVLGADYIIMGDTSYIGKNDTQESNGLSSESLINYYKLNEQNPKWWMLPILIKFKKQKKLLII